MFRQFIHILPTVIPAETCCTQVHILRSSHADRVAGSGVAGLLVVVLFVLLKSLMLLLLVLAGVVDLGEAAVFCQESVAGSLQAKEDRETDPTLSAGLFQGDIAFESPDELLSLLQTDEDSQEHFNSPVRNLTRLWPNNQIPYEIEDEYSSRERRVIRRAMKDFETRTCLRFVHRHQIDQEEGHTHYLNIHKGDGCWSYIGRTQRGKQGLSLGDGCLKIGIIVHELMHAIGMHHEHSRMDRDEFITINWENIKEEAKYNFYKLKLPDTRDLGYGYNYASVMHYMPYSFSRNKKPTISSKKPGVTLGQRSGLSKVDAQRVNRLYNCDRATCEDESRLCPEWAEKGWCTFDPEAMSVYCRRACGLCVPKCADEEEYCDFWAGENYCKDSVYSEYMNAKCKKACRVCV